MTENIELECWVRKVGNWEAVIESLSNPELGEVMQKGIVENIFISQDGKGYEIHIHVLPTIRVE